MQDYPKALPSSAAVGFTVINQVLAQLHISCNNSYEELAAATTVKPVNLCSRLAHDHAWVCCALKQWLYNLILEGKAMYYTVGSRTNIDVNAHATWNLGSLEQQACLLRCEGVEYLLTSQEQSSRRPGQGRGRWTQSQCHYWGARCLPSELQVTLESCTNLPAFCCAAIGLQVSAWERQCSAGNRIFKLWELLVRSSSASLSEAQIRLSHPSASPSQAAHGTLGCVQHAWVYVYHCGYGKALTDCLGLSADMLKLLRECESTGQKCGCRSFRFHQSTMLLR